MPRTAHRNTQPEHTQPRPSDGPQRLQKVLAAAGIASRRESESLILEGRVEVDGHVVAELGVKVDPAAQEIRLDGEVLRTPKRVYYAVNKPPGVLSTARDPDGRPRVIDLVPKNFGHVFNVGRLDASSEGLILVTNDGELANRLTHPRHEIPKIYLATVSGAIEESALKQLRKGMHLAEGFARVVSVRVKKRHKKASILEIVLDEGRNREIRRLLARVGHKVIRLQRIAIGPLRLGMLPIGASRPLTPPEVTALRQATGLQRAPSRSRGRPKRREKK